MTLLILDRFWNSSNIETTLVKIPLVLNTEKKQEAFCLYYDNNSLLQLLVVLIILKYLFSALMQMRQYYFLLVTAKLYQTIEESIILP